MILVCTKGLKNGEYFLFHQFQHSFWVLIEVIFFTQNIRLGFVLFDSLHPSQQFFCNVGMGLPGLNQY